MQYHSLAKLLLGLSFVSLCQTSIAQETLQFRRRDLVNDVAKLTITFAKERRDCKAFYEYLGQKREYWVVDKQGEGDTQTLTLRYDSKDATLKRNGRFATLQWEGKPQPEKYGVDISFSDVGEKPALFAVQYTENETEFYYTAPNGRKMQLLIEADSPAKFWDIRKTQVQTFKLSSAYLTEIITLTIKETDLKMHGLPATISIGGKTRPAVSIVEND